MQAVTDRSRGLTGANFFAADGGKAGRIRADGPATVLLQENPDLAEARFLLGKALLDSGVADAEVRQLLDVANAGWQRKDDPDAVAPTRTRLALAHWLLMNGDEGRARDLLDDLQATASRADLQTRTGAEKLRAVGVEPTALIGFDGH